MISRIASITSSHVTAIPTDEGRIYSRIGKVLPPCAGIASVKDTYAAFVKDRYENFQSGSVEKATNIAKPDLASNTSLHGFGVALYAAGLQHAPNRQFGKESHLLIIRA